LYAFVGGFEHLPGSPVVTEIAVQCVQLEIERAYVVSIIKLPSEPYPMLVILLALPAVLEMAVVLSRHPVVFRMKRRMRYQHSLSCRAVQVSPCGREIPQKYGISGSIGKGRDPLFMRIRQAGQHRYRLIIVASGLMVVRNIHQYQSDIDKVSGNMRLTSGFPRERQ